MAEKTIKISPVPEAVTQEEIKNALGEAKVTRIHLGKSEAYVELESTDDLETLEFISTDNQLDKLNGAEFQKVAPSFKWGSFGSDSSSIQQLKQEREHFDKHEENPWVLTEPSPQNLIVISNCDSTILQKLSENALKRTIFSEFKSINRILKKQNKVIVQLENPAQTEKLEGLFPNLKVSSLGSEAYVNLDDVNEPNFSSEWIQQHKRQTDIKSQNEDSHKKQEEEEKPKKYLHDQIIPKLNKLTSMQTDFLSSQQAQGNKTATHHHEIPEQSEQNIHTKNEINEDRQQFVLTDLAEKEREEAEKRKKHQQEERIRQEQEEKKRKLDEQLRIQKLKQEQERRKLKEQQQHKKAEQDKKRKEEQQEVRRREQEKEKHQEQERKKNQEQERKKHQEQERYRKQQQEQKKKQQQHRKEQQRIQHEKREEEKRAQQRKAKQEEERKRKQSEDEAKRKSEQQSLRKQQESDRARAQEEQRKSAEKSDRARAEEEQRKSAEKSEFILMPSADTVKKNLESMIGAGTDRIEQLINHEPRTPIIFWGLIIVTVFAMLLI